MKNYYVLEFEKEIGYDFHSQHTSKKISGRKFFGFSEVSLFSPSFSFK